MASQGWPLVHISSTFSLPSIVGRSTRPSASSSTARAAFPSLSHLLHPPISALAVPTAHSRKPLQRFHCRVGGGVCKDGLTPIALDKASGVAAAILHVPPLLFHLLCPYRAPRGRMSTAGSQTLASGARAAGSEKSTGKNTQREMGRCIWQEGLGEGRMQELNLQLAQHGVSTAQGRVTKVCRLLYSSRLNRSKEGRLYLSRRRRSLPGSAQKGSGGGGGLRKAWLRTEVIVLYLFLGGTA